MNNVESSTAELECGEPQGSILSPLIFLLFINDLPLYTKNVFTDLYANDTTLNLTGRSQFSVQENLRLALLKLFVWCKHNGMLLNTEKTKLMLITTPKKRLHLQYNILHLTYNNEILKNIENDKVLGVHIDKKFNLDSPY